MAKQKQQKRKDAVAALEARLVYVRSSERYFDTQQQRILSSDHSIEHQFMPLMPMRSNGRMNPVKLLKSSTTKRIIDGMGFHPGEGPLFQYRGETFANGYRNRLPTPLEPTKGELQRIEWIFDRIDDDVYRKWLLQYYGHVVQKPGLKIKSAPLIWSETQRNGKTTLLKNIPALLVEPRHSVDIDIDLLSSNFNDYLLGAWHVNLTEFRAGSRGERTLINNKLKAYIADDAIPVHPKGLKGYTLPNHFFLTASSNQDDAAAIDANDERWGIHEMKAAAFTEAERRYFYGQFMETERAAAVLRHYFLHVDLTGFQRAGSPPMTEAKKDMVEASAPSDYELLQTMFEERSGIFSRDIVLTSEVMAYIHKNSHMRPALTRIGKILAKPPFNGKAHQFRVGDGRYRAVILRNYDHWLQAGGKTVMAHIQGDDDEIDILS
jgi:hypothetical protein